MAPPTPSRLDDPAYAAFAWSRFRRMLGWMALTATMVAGIAWWTIERGYGPLGWIARASILGGVFATVLMAGALMGLAFLSSGTGHDEAVRDVELDR